MTATDFVLKIIALGVLAVFFGVIVTYVPEVELIIVFGLVYLMALYDFWLAGRRRKR